MRYVILTWFACKVANEVTTLSNSLSECAVNLELEMMTGACRQVFT